MERRENKKRGREGEAAMKSSEKRNAKKRGLLLSGDSCLCDNSSLEEGEQSNEHRPPRKYEEEDGNGSEVGVFDFPWLKEGTTSKGYYDDDHYECRLEFEDLVAGCWSGAYDASSSACLDFTDFSLDHHFFQQNYDHRTAGTTMTRRSDNDNDCGGEVPILRDKTNVEELDGIWSSVLDQPLDNNIVSFHKL
nr:hypothetical protein DM860_007558 [Ipomoea batatas]